MAAIYLRHPIHGEKVAASDIEAKHDKEHGWVEFDPAATAVPAFLAPTSTSDSSAGDEDDEDDEDDEEEDAAPVSPPVKPLAKAAPKK